jgi:hypothetical protein
MSKTLNRKEGLGVKLNLEGEDGNAFALMAAFKQAALRQGIERAEVDKVLKEAMSGDYDHLVQTLITNCV